MTVFVNLKPGEWVVYEYGVTAQERVVLQVKHVSSRYFITHANDGFREKTWTRASGTEKGFGALRGVLRCRPVKPGELKELQRQRAEDNLAAICIRPLKHHQTGELRLTLEQLEAAAVALGARSGLTAVNALRDAVIEAAKALLEAEYATSSDPFKVYSHALSKLYDAVRALKAQGVPTPQGVHWQDARRTQREGEQ